MVLCVLSQAPTKAREHRWGFKGTFITNTKLEMSLKELRKCHFSVVTASIARQSSSILLLDTGSHSKNREADPSKSEVIATRAILV